MALSLKYAVTLSATYNSSRGLLTGAGSLSFPAIAVSLTDGTAAGQADGLFSDDVDINAGDVITYDLSSGLIDLYGNELDFQTIKVIVILADISNVEKLVVGGGTWPGPFGAPSDTLLIRPGCSLSLACSDAVGWPVQLGADGLNVTSAGDASYSILIVGVSAALSAPNYSLAPAFAATPTVGVPAVVSDGDWSGNPTFSYVWTIAGVLIPNQKGPTYTPVAADGGKPLIRVMTAANIAGSTVVSTVAAIVAAAPLAGVVTNLVAGTTGQSLFT